VPAIWTVGELKRFAKAANAVPPTPFTIRAKLNPSLHKHEDPIYESIGTRPYVNHFDSDLRKRF